MVLIHNTLIPISPHRAFESDQSNKNHSTAARWPAAAVKARRPHPRSNTVSDSAHVSPTTSAANMAASLHAHKMLHHRCAPDDFKRPPDAQKLHTSDGQAKEAARCK